ncbi:MAG: phage major capsid protein [Propionibacteriaceae bacterium]|nr:phage major capsid protein [Propionibacteriaceae bacterium]
MAITASTKTTDFSGFLNPGEAAPIFDRAARQSVYQQLFPRVPLGMNGEKIPVVTSKPTANWVGEGEKKPATNMGLGLVHIAPKKLAAIAVMSAEVVRANPGNYTGKLREGLAEAFATAFDYAVGYNLGGDGTGTGPFDHYLNATTKRVEIGTTTQANGGIHGDLVAGMKLLVDDKRRLTGFGLDDTLEPDLWGAVDANGRPIYVDLPTDDVSQAIARPGRLLNRPSFMGEGVGNDVVVGFGGDFRRGAWGAVGGISYRVSTEATVTINGTLTSLWENNLVAVLAEAEYGFVLADEDAEDFVAYERAAAIGG